MPVSNRLTPCETPFRILQELSQAPLCRAAPTLEKKCVHVLGAGGIVLFTLNNPAHGTPHQQNVETPEQFADVVFVHHTPT